MVKKFRKGSSTLSEVLLQQLEENKKEDLLAKLFGEHTETPDMKVPEITDEQVREPDKVLLATREKCPFCKKVLDDLRVQTLQRRIYMKEHLQSSYLLGDPTSMSAEDVKSGLLRVRRFGGGLKELSLQNALKYWGDVDPGEVDAPEEAHAGEVWQVRQSQNARVAEGGGGQVPFGLGELCPHIREV